MAKRNYFTPSKKSWGFPNWKATCPAFTFKTVKQDKFPDFIPESLSIKYNSGYFASSGTTAMYQGENTDFYIGFFVGLRRDKVELDEQPYVAVFNQKTGDLAFDGYLQHGNYPGRTTQLTSEQLSIINSSGLTVDIKTNRLPDIDTGPILYLSENKIIDGIETTAVKAMEELLKKNYP